jgi:hypothetical protein
MIGLFLLGFTYCDDREKESDRISYSDARSLVTFFWVSYCERVFMFVYDTKEKEHQNIRQSDLYSGATPPRTDQIASCFDVLSIT